MYRRAFCVVATLAFQPSTAFAIEYGDIIGQCLEDNADEGQMTEALATYCLCADGKMMQDNYGRAIDI